jgi:cytochrome b
LQGLPRPLSGEELSAPEEGPERVTVWDLPTRLVHWLIVLLVAGSWWTGEEDLSERHAVIGYTILALLLFRLAWGFIGSETARFSSFVRAPSHAIEHLRHLLGRGKLERTVGHNALGGYAVTALLLCLAVQVCTGLFLYDEEYFWAPLNGWVSEETAELLSNVHEANFKLLLVLIGVHVGAVIFYALVKGLDLLRPMLSGRAEFPPGTRPPRIAPLPLALALAAAAGLVVWSLVSFA